MAWAIRMPMLKRMKDPAKSEEDIANLLFQCSGLEGQRTCTVKMIQPLRNSSSASDDFQSQRLACDRGNCGLADARLQAQSMIRKSGSRFSLATNAERVCAEIMLKQRDEIMMRFHQIAS
jgi:hypothetical protein